MEYKQSTLYRSSRGFTIIEMMIAMTILSFIALAVYQNTTQSFVLRDNVEQEGDFYNSVRVALDALGRDITHIYTPNEAALPGSLRSAPSPSPAPQVPGYTQSYAQVTKGPTFQPIPASKYWGESINAEGVRPTRLQGESDKMSFITNNHMRLFRDTPECDFSKIEYSLAEEKEITPGVRGKILRRREDSAVFEDIEKLRDDESVSTVDLISGVKDLKIRYLDGEKDSWSTRWDTAGMDHKNVFPSVIEITLEVYMPKRNTPGGKEDNERPTFKVVERFRPEEIL